MKRFNTDRIRQRMREHNERFPNSKGKLLSSAPVRIKITSQNDKENLVPVRNDANSMSQPDQTSTEDMATKAIPQIYRSVTMSEADEENASNSVGMAQNESIVVSEEDNSTVPSVWAMMENYHGSFKDMTTPSKSPIRIEENDSDGSSNYHSTEESLASDASSVEEMVEVPSRIHWVEDDDGELMQESYYTQEPSDVGNDEKLEGIGNHGTDLSTVDESEKFTIFRKDAPSCVSDQAISSVSALRSNGGQVQPTPARVKEEWVHAGDDEDVSTNPDSLLQESMIQSMNAASNHGSRATASMASNLSANLQLGNDSDTELSLSILPDPKMFSGLEADLSADATVEKMDGKRKPKLHIQTQDLESVYSNRLGELESNLKLQQNNTDEVQNRLKQRVLELEQALKVTVATPKGTVVDENPLKILLNRNQTLVKEVRFADQTCVELSSKISELEKRNERLQKQNTALQLENNSPRSGKNDQDDIRSESLFEKEEAIENLEKELTVANESLHTKVMEEENLFHMLNQALGDLNVDDDIPALSMASSIASDHDSVFYDRSVDSDGVQLRSTIQQQIRVLVEKARNGLKMEKLRSEMHDLRSENIALKSELLLDHLQADPNRISNNASTGDHEEELVQVQKENEFLGRQLGMVQEKLDQAQTNLNDERQKTESLKSQLERGVEMYENLIEPLEKRLLEGSNSDPKLQELADVDERLLSFQKEFIHIKASISAMKSESVRILSSEAFKTDTFSNTDQQQHVISIVRATLSRMAKNYKQLESDVETMADGISERLDGLTATISHLRSSLMFEKESVSSVGSGVQEQSYSNNNFASSIDFINASIPVPQDAVEDGDDLIEMANRATGPRKHEISVTSDLDDISRLLNDDLTLESIVKSVSVLTPMSNMEAFKESLEAAVNECKRVKERSVKLKDQIESQKEVICELENEKENLSIAATRRNEEFHLVERALEEARDEIDLLTRTISASQSENENLYEQLKIRETEWKLSKQANDRLKNSIAEIEKEKEALEVRIKESENALTQAQTKLQSAVESNNDYKKQLKDSKSNISRKLDTVIEQKETESAEIRKSLQLALTEQSELKRFHQDALKRLSQEVESKLKLESLVNELQHSKLQAQSDLEDKDLESQFAYEDMRKERAELKHRLSQSEKEVLSLKESYTTYKAAMEDKLLSKEDTDAQMLDLLSKVNSMAAKRMSFVKLLVSLGSFEDIIRAMNSKDFHLDQCSPLDSTMKEIDCWECVIPLIGEKIEAMHQTIPKLELEIETLSHNLSKESDQTKNVEENASQNEKLLDLLRQAEQEMERSTRQIKEMSEAMGLMQKREAEADNTIELLKSELMKLQNDADANTLAKTEDLTKLKNLLVDTSEALEKKESQIREMDSQMNNKKSEIVEITALLRSKESEERSLKTIIQSFEKKNSRLREYIRKLTNKCEEWEISYDRQSRAIDRLQEKKARMKERAADIAGRYRSLVSDINRRKKMHQDDREKWSQERSNLNSVHAALERELEQIAKELA